MAHPVIADSTVSTSGAPLLPPQALVGDASFTLAVLSRQTTPPPPQLPEDEDYMVMKFHEEWGATWP